MKMKAIVSYAVIALAISSSQASAQDADLSGFYVGGLVGVDSLRISDIADSGSEEDIGYGVTAGYDYELDSGVVVGVEGEWSDSEVSVIGNSVTLSAGRDLYLGLRGGFGLGARGMIYAKGGYTNAKLRFTNNGATIGPVSGSDEQGGFRLGAGGEWMFGQGNFGVRAEYRYSDYGEYNFEGGPTGLSAKRHQGIVGLIGKF